MRKIYLILFSLIFLPDLTANAQGVPSKAHRAREAEYDVKFYFLDLDIEKATTTISGNVLTRANSLVSSLDTFAVELASQFVIDSVKAALEGGAFIKTTATKSGKEVNVLLPFTASMNQSVEVRIYYHGTPALSDGGTGSYISGVFGGSLFGTGKTSQIFSASPPYNSSCWWPCKQVLSDKADSSWFFITTSSTDKAVSNGLLTNTVNLGGKNRWEWKSQYPINFYLVSFAIDSYGESTKYWHPEGRTDSMLIKGYNYGSSYTTKILDVYSKLFGLYPFYKEKLAIINVDDFGGGIENQTMIVLGDPGFSSNYETLESHEIAHQWWGDNVTCGSWRDIMLNEGFAQWCQSVYHEFTTTGDKNVARKSHFSDDVTTSSVYGTSMNDTTTVNGVFLNQSLYYDKAAMVINSLRFEINNDSLFFLGLRNYQREFSGKSALGSDLKKVMDTTCKKDLTDFFNQWYYKGGAPTFNIKWNQVGNEVMLQINETSNNVSNPLFKTPVEIKIVHSGTGTDTTVRLDISKNVSYFHFPYSANVGSFTVDPNQWITNGTGTTAKDAALDVFSASLNGNIQVCDPLTNPQTYTSLAKAGHTYEWKVSNGNINSGQGTTDLGVTWNATGVQQISVKECNAALSYCDSTLLNVIVGNNSTLTQNIAINSGDSLFLEGAWRKTGGSFTDHFTSSLGCDSTVTTNLSITTGAGDIQLSTHYFIFPNPANNRVIISGTSMKNTDIRIFDLLGRERFSIDNYTADEVIELSTLNSGLYFVHLNDGQSKSVLKLEIVK